MSTEITAKPRYEILDGLRGVAAMTVVAFHLFETYATSHFDQIVNHGYLAVDFFFVLSGFVIGYAYDDRWAKGLTTWQFFKRRLIRLHPMVIVGTLFGAALFYFTDSHPAFTMISGVSVGKLLAVTLVCCLMLPCGKALDIRGWDESSPLDGPAWTLQYEYLANILYATILRRLKTAALAVLVLLTAALTVCLCLNLDFTGLLAGRTDLAYTVIGGWSLDPREILIGFTRLLYPFLAGLLLSRLKWIIPVRRGGFLLCSGLILALLAMPCLGTSERPWTNGLYEAAAILVAFPLIVSLGAGSVSPSGRLGRLCAFSGAISFPLYITHYPLVYLQMDWSARHPHATLAQNVFVGVALYLVALGLAWAALRLYDMPVRKWLSARRRKGS